MRLEHVNLTVSDVERSVAFYRGVFGFGVRWQGTVDEGRPAAHVGGDDFYLALFEARGEGRASIDYGAVGINHFGFVVDDLDALKRRLDELGVHRHLEADYDPGRRSYFLDPDGHEVEIVEYAAAGRVSPTAA